MDKYREDFLKVLTKLSGCKDRVLEERQVSEAFADLKLDGDQLQQVIAYLRSNGITVLEEKRRQDQGEDRSGSWPYPQAELALPSAEKNNPLVREYFGEICGYERVSFQEDKDLSEAYLFGDSMAAARLTQGNLHLAFRIAAEYYQRDLSVSFYDLMQEGNLGLYTALSRYSRSLGMDFSEYACLWIRQSVLTAIAQSEREKGFASELAQILNRIRESARDITRDLGEEPSAAELAQYLDIPREKLKKALTLAEDPQIRIGDMEEQEELLSDREGLYDRLQEELSGAYPMEKLVLTWLLSGKRSRGRTVEAAARRYGISPDRVRQMLARLLHRERARQRRENGTFSQA